ncbi:MAG: MobA/MobL family protein, partial [Lachnospiraceae bacterium]
MSKLPDVRGRITYISSHAKQENLYAVYETADRHYWTELAKCNQQEFEKSGTEGKCIEAREFIIALPESFPNLYEPDKLLQIFTDRFKEKYGVECVSALHHNKRKTNYHIHLIFSERKLLPEPMEKTATRNMFYGENGRHVRTKKEILDENGNVRKGCKIVKKGEVYERDLFTAKNKLFKQEDFVDEVKHFYTDLINLLVKDDKEKLHVFDSSGLYLATKKIGKNNPKAEQIQTDNEMRMRWNCEVDRAIVSGVSETEIQQIKKKYITDRIKESVDIFGSQPERLGSIIMTAVTALALLISKVLDKARELSAKFFENEIVQPIAEPSEKKTAKIISQTDKLPKQETPKIPPKPVMSAEAAIYPKLLKIYKELNRQNGIIFDAERERNELELERDSLKGLAKLTKKGELQ